MFVMRGFSCVMMTEILFIFLIALNVFWCTLDELITRFASLGGYQRCIS